MLNEPFNFSPPYKLYELKLVTAASGVWQRLEIVTLFAACTQSATVEIESCICRHSQTERIDACQLSVSVWKSANIYNAI